MYSLLFNCKDDRVNVALLATTTPTRRRCRMPFRTGLMQRLSMRYPIIQAPLAGGGDTPQLVAAVGEAGALGFIGAAYLTPQQILDASRAVRGLTARPFGISLF